jgi:hypothetical protein
MNVPELNDNCSVSLIINHKNLLRDEPSPLARARIFFLALLLPFCGNCGNFVLPGNFLRQREGENSEKRLNKCGGGRNYLMRAG